MPWGKSSWRPSGRRKASSAAGATSSATFDPTLKDSLITLSNGNLTATKITSDGKSIVLASVDIPANKRIPVEINWTVIGGNAFTPVAVGLFTTAVALSYADDASDQGADHGVVMTMSDQTFSGITGGPGTVSDTYDSPAAWAQGDTELYLIDTFVNKLWCCNADGVWHGDATTGHTNDPTTNTGGLAFATITVPFRFNVRLYHVGDACIINFGATPFVRAALIPVNYTDRM